MTKKIFLIFISISFISFFGCKDDNPTAGSTSKDCQITQMGTKNELYTFEYDGEKLIKMTDTSGSFYEFTYSGDKVISYAEMGPGFNAVVTINYSSTNSDLIDNLSYNLDGDYLLQMNFTHNSDNKITQIQTVNKDGQETQILSYEWDGDNVTKVTNSSIVTKVTKFTKFGSKILPSFETPLYLTQLSDPLFHCKNNPLEGNVDFLGVDETTFKYEEADGRIVKIERTTSGITNRNEFQYTCE